MIDLHTHTTRSDGTVSPTDLIEQSLALGLHALSITDHDTVQGARIAQEYLQNHPHKSQQLQFIPGIELSTRVEGVSSDIHIVGLNLDLQSSALKNHTSYLENDRYERNLKMMTLIQQEGYPITLTDVQTMFPKSIITRAHVARYLVDQEYFPSISSVFNQLLGNDCPGFVPRLSITSEYGIRVIKESGGVPILAHPTLYHLDSNGLYSLIDQLKQQGLIGMEAYYSTYSPAEHKAMLHLCDRFDLLPSGGSDYHGTNKPHIQLGIGMGNLNVPDHLLEGLLPSKT